jgi:Skp family chaperone for outer membrane proteins
MFMTMACLAPLGLGADSPLPGIAAEAIGLLNPTKIEEKFPEYIKLKELKKAYDSELYVYRAYLLSQAQSYAVELNKKKEVELAGQPEAMKKEIETKYATMIKAKQDEINQQIQVKLKDLQAKLKAEEEKVDAKLKSIVAVIGAEKHLAIVINKMAVYFGGTDITDAVIARATATVAAK